MVGKIYDEGTNLVKTATVQVLLRLILDFYNINFIMLVYYISSIGTTVAKII